MFGLIQKTNFFVSDWQNNVAKRQFKVTKNWVSFSVKNILKRHRPMYWPLCMPKYRSSLTFCHVSLLAMQTQRS